MVVPLQEESPVLPHSVPGSETSSDDIICLDDIARRTIRLSESTPKRRYSYIQRYSAIGTDINLTITEPKHSNPHALHLGPRFSIPPGITGFRSPRAQFIRSSVSQQIYQRSTLSNVVRAVQYDEPQDSAIKHVKRLWSPWALRVFTLLALLVFFLGCIAILEVLSLLSKREDALGRWSQTARFIWTYVPPLLFFIVASVWEQVEYRTKQLMPWRTMAAAPASASHSILLNYVTPLNVLAFLQSISLGHPGVAVAIAAGVLIKFLIITSTAILSLQSGTLCLQTIPLRMMEVFLALLSLSTAAMLFLCPSPATPNDTSTIAGLAAVLSNSPRYTSAIRGFAMASPKLLEEEVYKHRYQTNVGSESNEPFFRISLAWDEYAPPPTALLSDLPKNVPPEKWWVPIHDLTRVGILAIIVGVIAATELLHQHSEKNSGLMDIADSSLVRYAWQMVPAIVAMAMFMLVGLVDYATRLIQPFQMLKRGNAPAERTIQVNYLSCLAPAAVIKGFRNRHFGVIFSATAVLIAPLLTIVSSGLFFPATLQLTAATSFHVSSTVDPSKNETSSEFIAAANAVIKSGDSTWPRWTHDKYVFATLTSTTTTGAFNSSAAQSLTARLPATYGILNCTVIPSNTVRVWTSSTNDTTNQIQTQTTIKLAIPVYDGCGAPCRTTNDINTCDGKPYIYASLATPPAGTFVGSMFSAKPIPAPDTWSDSCPQLSVAYGKSVENGSQIAEVVAMNCYPALIQSQADVTIDMPQGEVRAATIDISTAKRVALGERATVNLSSILTASTPSELSGMDETLVALTTGRDAIALDQMLGESNAQHVNQALDRLYGRVMAQHLNLQSRVSASSTSSKAADIITGDLTATRTRLVQDEMSTRIIEGILGAIFFLLAVPSVIVDTRKVLPYNPFTIARMSSLITESNLIDGTIPAGSEWATDQDIKRRNIFDAFVFSLGSFERPRSKGRKEKVFGIDIGGAETFE